METTKGHLAPVQGQDTSRVQRAIFPHIDTEHPANPDITSPAYRARALRSTRAATTARQRTTDAAKARSFIYWLLTRAFAYPTDENWRLLCNPTMHTKFCSAVRFIAGEEQALWQSAKGFTDQLHPGQFESFVSDYIAVFGQEPGALANPEPGNARNTPEPLAALTALMHRFGLELARSVSSRTDQLCTELELMSILTCREAEALEQFVGEEALASCHNAQQEVLCAHLARHVLPPFVQAGGAVGGVFASLAAFTRLFVETEQRLSRPHKSHTSKAKRVPGAGRPTQALFGVEDGVRL